MSVYAVDPFTAGIFASNSIMGNGFATAANGVAPASFDRRQPNLIQYALPERSGFGGRLAYAPSEEKTATRAPDFLSGMLKYEQGPLFLAYGFEQHREYFAAGTRDMAHRIGAAYSFGPTRLRFSWERLRYEPTASSNLTRDALQLAATHEIGAATLRASYVRAGRTKGNASVASAALLGLRAGHRFWRHTSVTGLRLQPVEAHRVVGRLYPCEQRCDGFLQFVGQQLGRLARRAKSVRLGPWNYPQILSVWGLDSPGLAPGSQPTTSDGAAPLSCSPRAGL